MIDCKSKFYTDTEIAIMRVARDGDALKRLKDYRNNKEVVKAAINHLPQAYSYASEELRDDEEIFLAAMLHSDIRGYHYVTLLQGKFLHHLLILQRRKNKLEVSD